MISQDAKSGYRPYGVHSVSSAEIVLPDFTGKKILIVDSEPLLAERLAEDLERKGFKVLLARDYEAARQGIAWGPDYAVLDFHICGGSGFDILETLRSTQDIPAIFVSNRMSPRTAVTAIKRGARDCLPKPQYADAVVMALTQGTDRSFPPPPPPLENLNSFKRKYYWPYIAAAFEECERDVSATARYLNMHPRSLQRIMAKSGNLCFDETCRTVAGRAAPQPPHGTIAPVVAPDFRLGRMQ